MTKNENNILIEKQNKKIDTLKKVIDELEKHLRKNKSKKVDSVSLFIDDQCNRSVHSKIIISELYNAYKKWCSEKSGMYIFSQAVFRYYLENTLAFKTRRNSDGFVYVLDVELVVKKEGCSNASKTDNY